MNKILLILFIGLLFMTSGKIVAQSETATVEQTSISSDAPEKYTEEITKMLGLSTDQEKEILTMFKERERLIKSGEQPSISKGNTLEDELRKILTKEQYQKYYEITTEGFN